MLEQLKERLGEAFTEELQTELQNKIENLVESKAEVLSAEKISAETDRLNDLCEEYKSETVKDMKNYVNEKLEKLDSIVEQYVDYVVSNFIETHEETFAVTEAEAKSNIIMDALANMCTIAGISAHNITENADQYALAPVSCSESAKTFRMIDHMRTLNEKIENLQNENSKLIQIGIIAELKEGMTDMEAQKFERIAENIKFSRDRSYLNKLDDLKERIISESNEDEDEDEDLTESVHVSRQQNSSLTERFKNLI